MKFGLLVALINIFFLSLQARQEIHEPHDDEAYWEVVNDDHPWPLYLFEDVFSFFHVRFPKTPTIEENKGNIILLSIDTSTFPIVAYALTYSSEKRIEVPEELYEDYLNGIEESRCLLVRSEINFDEEFAVLDFFSVDTVQHIGRKERIIVTSDNVFYLTTIFFFNSIQNHEAFINSFDFGSRVF